MSVMEQAFSYLQEQMSQEQLDLIVCTVQLPTQRKARAYTFHNRLLTNDRDQTRRAQQITRVADSEVIDGVTSANIDMLIGGSDPGQQPNIRDFNLSFKRDIILRKFHISSIIINILNNGKNCF